MLRKASLLAVGAILAAAGCSNKLSFGGADRPIEGIVLPDDTEARIAPAPAPPHGRSVAGHGTAPIRKDVSARPVAPPRDRKVLHIVDSDAGLDSALTADLARIVGADRLDIRAVQSHGLAADLSALMRSEVDLAIVSSNAWQSLPDDGVRTGARDKLRYIAGLYAKDLHVLARRELTEIRRLHQRKVGIGRSGTETNVTARQLFAQLGIEPTYEEFDNAAALEALQAGRIDAALLLERRPADILRDLPKDDRFHLVPLPYEDDVALGYVPGRFDETDYPNLVDKGRRVETIAISTVLAVPNMPETSARNRRLALFTTRFFALFSELERHGDSKWAAAQLSLVVDGWRRYKPAEEALRKSASQGTEKARSTDARVAALTGCGAAAPEAEALRLNSWVLYQGSIWTLPPPRSEGSCAPATRTDGSAVR